MRQKPRDSSSIFRKVLRSRSTVIFCALSRRNSQRWSHGKHQYRLWQCSYHHKMLPEGAMTCGSMHHTSLGISTSPLSLQEDCKRICFLFVLDKMWPLWMHQHVAIENPQLDKLVHIHPISSKYYGFVGYGRRVEDPPSRVASQPAGQERSLLNNLTTITQGLRECLTISRERSTGNTNTISAQWLSDIVILS